MFNSKSKIRAMHKHIELREVFFDRKYNAVQRAYAMFRMTFHKEDLIRKSNIGLNEWIHTYGNFLAFKKAIEG